MRYFGVGGIGFYNHHEKHLVVQVQAIFQVFQIAQYFYRRNTSSACNCGEICLTGGTGWLITRTAITLIINNNEAVILYPVQTAIAISSDFNQLTIDKKLAFIASCNGRDVKIFDNEGSLIHSGQLSAGKKSSVKDIHLYDSRLIYYLDKKIFSCQITTGEVSPLLEQNLFPPPYKKLSFKVYMSRISTEANPLYILKIIDIILTVDPIRSAEFQSLPDFDNFIKVSQF